LGALAYADRQGRLVCSDSRGYAIEVPGSSRVLLPSWSCDGRRIAFVERGPGTTLELHVVDVVER
jgi:Tol biopolymer transport system component